MRLKIRIILLIVLTNMMQQASACDVCGCAVNSQSLGLLPQFSKHFVGLQYLYYSSQTSHPSLFEGKPNEEANQQYKQIQVWGRLQIAKRFQLFAFVPYVQSVNMNNLETMRNSGIGDISIMGNFSVPLKERENITRLLLVGLGLKLPTGKFDISNNTSLSGLSTTQTGTGALDLLANLNYTHKWTSWGYNVDANYSLTTANKVNYKYGNKLSVGALAFYWLEKKQLKIVPQLGFRMEHALHDYTNFQKKYLSEETGGFVSFATLGSQFFYKKIGAKLSIQMPLYQQTAQNIVQYHSRIETGFFFLF